MKRHNLQPSFRESSESLRQQAASTNLPMPSTPASGNGVYALALDDTPPHIFYGRSSICNTEQPAPWNLNCWLRVEGHWCGLGFRGRSPSPGRSEASISSGVPSDDTPLPRAGRCPKHREARHREHGECGPGRTKPETPQPLWHRQRDSE